MLKILLVAAGMVILILIFRFVDKKSRPKFYKISKEQIKKTLSLELIRILEEECILEAAGQAITTELIHRLFRNDMDRSVAERNVAGREKCHMPPPGFGLGLSPLSESHPSQRNENKEHT